ncbi:hypothetical protein RhiirC2_857078 [Rhizophagus irregularis]|uniref:DUF8211 domain-containing protein n=1 Tax=Rhizophagus irregularis TaxID=588596 RepID=A0A2N1MEB4_9GLOM|nr:hypothetical protein RhiirC2_857078 [Rhizophagus irregularis]
MSYFPRADDFAPALGYDHTPADPDDFIFNHDITQTVSPTEDTLSDTPSLSNAFEDFRPCSSPPKNFIFSTKYEKFHVTPHHRAGFNKIYNFRRSKSFFFELDNKIPDVSYCKTFKDFHASCLCNRWAKKKIHQNHSNRLGISFTTSYHAYNTNVVATKGLDFIYGKKYGNLQFTPSSSPKVKKRQEARFNALVRHTFHNAKLDDNALIDDKLRAARHHKLLFQENQQFTAPIKHLRYKKKFIIPSKDYYTFPIPFPETKTICNDSSVASTSNGNPLSSVNIDN